MPRIDPNQSTDGLVNATMTGVTNSANQLVQALETAIKNDSWGQRLEAAQQYRKVVSLYEEGSVNFCTDEEDEKRLERVFAQVKRRAAILDAQTLDAGTQVTLDAIKANTETLKEMIAKYEKRLNRRHSSVAQLCGDKLLLPRKPSKPGQSMLTIKIEKIGIKDAGTYVDPFITVKVKNIAGEDVCPEQNTPSSYHIQDNYILYNVNVHIPVPLEKLPKEFFVFFEFHHYKEKQDKVSCRCFSFIERQEIKEGCAVVEIYKKPVDYNRKKLYLLTEKTLYLHLYYTIAKGFK
uniref:C2 Aida-type domain-containing protein n=1 Tax=Plectus sambesii TaxID=2011161 RepID=A0A914UKX7_9BILA